MKIQLEEEKKEMLDDVSDVESEESEEEEDVDAVVGDEETVAKAKNILTNS